MAKEQMIIPGEKKIPKEQVEVFKEIKKLQFQGPHKQQRCSASKEVVLLSQTAALSKSSHIKHAQKKRKASAAIHSITGTFTLYISYLS